MKQADRPSRVIAAVCGLVIAGVALAVAEFVAGFQRVWRSPMLDVGDRMIDAAPPFVKEFAIDTFGTNDKKALLIGMGIVIAIAAMGTGIAALRHRLVYGVIGVGLFGLVGIWAASSRRTAVPWHVVVPGVAGALAGIGALSLLHASTTRRAPGTDADADTATVVPIRAGGTDRRQFLQHTGLLLGGLAVAAGAVGSTGRWLRSRFTAAESRAAVVLPTPTEALAELPPGVDLGVPGVTPFVTPNADFYRIDTALTVPQVITDDYRLRITGMVDDEIELSFDELLQRPMIERDITMTCVSNEIGGSLAGNARWLGTRLDDLLREAGVQPGADQVVGRSVDGFACGFPVAVAMDGRDALVVVGMNGEALPLEHGFPVRLVVPGLYGFVSATKWLTEIELTTFADVDHYWLQRGWAREAPIKLMSRIDTPRAAVDGDGRASADRWRGVGADRRRRRRRGADRRRRLAARAARRRAERRHLGAVDVRLAGRLRTASVRVRAIDANGAIQTGERAEPIPDGASGHHQIVVIVE